MRKKPNYIDPKQNATKKPMGQQGHQKKFKNTLRQMTIKTQPYKICRKQQKQFLEGGS